MNRTVGALFLLTIVLVLLTNPYQVKPASGSPKLNITEFYTPLDDAFVSQKFPQDNYGALDHIRINGPDTGIREQIIYLKFDLVGGEQVDNAVLKLFVTKTGGGGAVTTATQTDWNELEITYQTKPDYDETTWVHFEGGGRNTYLDIDISELELKHGLNTLVIAAFNRDGQIFSSKEAGSNPPILEVTFVSEGDPNEPTSTFTITPSPTSTPTPEPLPTDTPTPTALPSSTATPTASPSPTPTFIPPPADTPTPSPTPTPTVEPPGYYFPPPGETLEFQDQRLPGEVGLQAEVIQALTGRASRWALWRHGYLVHEEGEFNTNVEVKSLRKTLHAMSVGAAIQQGKLSSYDELISDYVPELPGNDALANFRHVMTQSAGFDYPGCGDPNDYLPGEMWTYSDYNPYYLNRAMAAAYDKPYTRVGYTELLREAYFDAIGLQGWTARLNTRELDGLGDGIRLFLDLEDMGRLGLLALTGGNWDGAQLIQEGFIQDLQTKQTYSMLVNYDGCNGNVNLNPDMFPEAPYGFMTWTNLDGDFYPGAGVDWSWGSGAGGFYLLWNQSNGIVFAAVGANTNPSSRSFPHIIEEHITGPNPLVGEGR